MTHADLALEQSVLGFLQRQLSALAIGDVAKDVRGADDFAPGVPERRDRQGNIEALAIPGQANGLVVIDALAGSDPRQYRHFLVHTVGRNEERDRPPDDFPRAIAE